MLPPKKWLTTGTSRMSSRFSDPTRGPSTRAPYSPVRMATGASPTGGGVGADRGARYPAAGAPSTAAKNPGRTPSAARSIAAEGGLEGPGHPQSVLVLGEALVGGRGRKGPLRHQVVLVGGEHHPPPDGCQKRLLPLLHHVAHRRGLATGVRSHGRFVREPAHPQRNAGHRGQRAGSDRARRQGCRPEPLRRSCRGTPPPARGPRCRLRAAPAATAG